VAAKDAPEDEDAEMQEKEVEKSDEGIK